MNAPPAVRWAWLAIRVFVAAGGSYLTAVAAGAHGPLLWLPPALAAATVLEAGVSQSPSAPDTPVPVSGPGGPGDPVNVEVKP